MTVINRLRAIREEMEVSRAELARRIGKSPRYLGFLETGKVERPRVDTCLTIARALGCYVEDLWKLES